MPPAQHTSSGPQQVFPQVGPLVPEHAESVGGGGGRFLAAVEAAVDGIGFAVSEVDVTVAVATAAFAETAAVDAAVASE